MGVLSAILLAFVSCYTGATPGSGVCLYNTEITYRYYSSPRLEEFDKVGTQTHLIFENDTLVGTLFLTASGDQIGAGLLDDATRQSVRRLQINLPPGTYQVYTWSNYYEGYSHFSPLVIGQTTRQEALLYQDNAISRSRSSGGLYSNCERLYFGEVEVEVPRAGRTQKTVDLLCAHTQFTFVVRWLSGPPSMAPLELQMDSVPTEYLQSISHALTMNVSGVPLYGPSQVYQQVPRRGPPIGSVVTPAVRLGISEATATMITYRHWDGTHATYGHDPLLTIWGGADGQQQLMKRVDLRDFFNKMGWGFTYNMKQYFDILVEIDGDDVWLSELGNIGWIDGGSFGGGA